MRQEPERAVASVPAIVRRPVLGLTAADPGLVRLRTAGTTVVTLMIAFAVLYGFDVLRGQPVSVALLGVVVAMNASLTVDDPEPRRRAVTTLLLIPPAAAAVTVGAVLSPYRIAADVTFVAIMVSTVFLRRLGNRGTAIGMVTYTAYFFALFLGATPGQLPPLIVAVAVGALVTLLVQALLRRQRPDRELRRMLDALAARAAGVTAGLADGLRSGRLDRRRRRRLGWRLGGTGEAARTVIDRLDTAGEPVLDVPDNETLSRRVLDFQLGLEHLTVVTVGLLDGSRGAERRTELADTFERVGSALRDRSAHGLDAVREGLGEDRSAAAEPVERVRTTLRRTVDHWRRAVEPDRDCPAGDQDDRVSGRGHDDTDDEGDGADDADDDGDGAEDAATSADRAPSDSLRQAVQIGCATSAAIVVGELLSPTRWFWAVITAFVVFVGTSTSGETLSKGWQRVLGTLGGVGAGVVVAAVVGGNTALALALIAVCLFLGFYLMQLSSGLMVFFITTVLALLYGLLGQFSVELLLVRLQETAAGAAIGVVVSFLILPRSTRRATTEALCAVLRDLAELIDRVAARERGENVDRSAVSEQVRTLGSSYGSARSTARPLTHGLAGLPDRSRYRRAVGLLGVCDHHARAFARVVEAAPPGGAMHRPELDVAAAAIRDTAATLADVLDGEHPHVTLSSSVAPALDAVLDTASHLPGADARRLGAIVEHLRAVDQGLRGLADEFGVHAETSIGTRAS